MSKIFVVSDDAPETRVEVMTLADPTAPDDQDDCPTYLAQCRTEGCTWNSFVTDNTIHLVEADAINDAENHVDLHDRALF